MISTTEDASQAPGVDHLIQAVFKRLSLRGFIVNSHEDLRAEFETEVAGWLRSGDFVSKQTVVEGLDRAADALIGGCPEPTLARCLFALPMKALT